MSLDDGGVCIGLLSRSVLTYERLAAVSWPCPGRVRPCLGRVQAVSGPCPGRVPAVSPIMFIPRMNPGVKYWRDDHEPLACCGLCVFFLSFSVFFFFSLFEGRGFFFHFLLGGPSAAPPLDLLHRTPPLHRGEDHLCGQWSQWRGFSTCGGESRLHPANYQLVIAPNPTRP